MNIKKFEKYCKSINEYTSSTGGSVVSSGMGAVVSAQPSSLAGTTIGPNWSSNGGTEGSGDISIPYNPSGGARVSQKIPIMGKSHGSMTGKKSREKKLDLKRLKEILGDRKKSDYTFDQSKGKKVLDYQDFIKYDFNKVKK